MGTQENYAGQAILRALLMNRILEYLDSAQKIGMMLGTNTQLELIGWKHECETSDQKRLQKSQFSRSIVDIHNIPTQEASLHD